MREASARLIEAEVSEATRKVEWLLCHHLKLAPYLILLDKERPVPEEKITLIETDLQRLLKHEPVQYVVGETEFFGFTIRCDARGLIPRFETEQMVDTLLKDKTFWEQPRAIIEIGTGTGCISIALAKHHPHSKFCAIDIHPETIALAQENIKLHNLSNVRLMIGDLLTGHPEQSADLIVANLPYISSSDVDALEQQVRDFEPRRALEGGVLGTELILQTAKQALKVLRSQGRIVLEIGELQGEYLQAEFEQLGYQQVQIHKDLAGKIRFLEATYE